MERLSVTEFWVSAMFAGMTAFSGVAPGSPSGSNDAPSPGASPAQSCASPLYEFRLEGGEGGKLRCILILAQPDGDMRILEAVEAASLGELAARLEAIEISRHLEASAALPDAGNMALLKGARQRLLDAQHKSAFEYAKDELLQKLEHLEENSEQLLRASS